MSNPVFGDYFQPNDSEKLVRTTEVAQVVLNNLAGLHARYSGKFDGPGAMMEETKWGKQGRGVEIDGSQSTETKTQHYFYTQGWDAYKAWEGEVLVKGTQVAYKMGEIPENIKALGDKLMVDFPKLYNLTFAREIEGSPRTLVHGDCSAGNMMFFNEDGNDACCIFDWQMAQMGRGVFDVAMFLVLSTPPDFLKDNEQALLQHYYDRLLEKGSGNATLAAYTKPQFDKDYANAVATVFAVMVYVAGLMQMGNKVEFYQPVAICADRVHAALSRWIGQIDTELGPFSTSYGTVPGQQ